MHWKRNSILAVLGLILATRIYFIQELVALLVIFALAFFALSLLALVFFGFLQLLNGGMNLVEPRLRSLAIYSRMKLLSLASLQRRS
jgi:hypothetical protein